MSRTIKITIQQLREHHACLDMLNAFQKLFGYEVIVTPELLRKHGGDIHEVDIMWASSRELFAPFVTHQEMAVAYDDAERERPHPGHDDIVNGGLCRLRAQL